MKPLQFYDAVKIFMKLVVRHAYFGAINTTVSLLTQGPPGRLKPQDKFRMHDWYISLESGDQSMVRAIIEEAVQASVFNFLVVLDNKTIGRPIDRDFSDFAVYLQRYSSEKDQYRNASIDATRINQSYKPDGDLHDLLDETIASSVDKKDIYE